MAVSTLVGVGPAVYDKARQWPYTLQLTSAHLPAGVRAGDRLFVVISSQWSGLNTSASWTVPGFTPVDGTQFGGGFGAPVNFTGCRVWTARYMPGLLPLTITATTTGPATTEGAVQGWWPQIVAYRDSRTVTRTGRGATFNNTTTLPTGGWSKSGLVSAQPDKTAVAVGFADAGLTGLSLGAGWTVRAGDAGGYRFLPDPYKVQFVTANTYFDAGGVNPASLTINAPPAGTQDNDIVLMYVQCSGSGFSTAPTVSPAPNVTLRPGAFGPFNDFGFENGAVGVGSMNLHRFKGVSMASTWPTTVTRPAGAVGAWVVHLVVYRPAGGEPYYQTTPYGGGRGPVRNPYFDYLLIEGQGTSSSSSATTTPAWVPLSTQWPKLRVFAAATCTAGVPPGGSSIGSLSGSANGWTERYRRAAIAGRVGGFLIADQGNDTSLTPVALTNPTPPQYGKSSGDLVILNSIVLAPPGRYRPVPMWLVDRPVPGAWTETDPVFAKVSGGNGGASVYFVLDTLDPAVRGARRSAGVLVTRGQR
ncbi:MAG: hypothetical protein ACOYOQ_00320 [Microthrixaceae bacterium]